MGNNIRIEYGNKTYLLSEYVNYNLFLGVKNISSSPLKALGYYGNVASVVNGVGTYYGSQVGVEGDVNMGVKINANALAFTTQELASGKKGDVSINVGMGLNELSNNYNNLKSTLSHEKGHQDNGVDNQFTPNLYNHAEVYLKQLTDVSVFSKTTETFRQSIIGSFANYLLNAEAKQYNNVQDLVDKFNKGNKQGYFLSLTLSSINNTTGDPTYLRQIFLRTIN